ncbi:MAG: hypothetical protein PUA90_01365 [bacterium]|nr:hypothetical protein [bacterium]
MKEIVDILVNNGYEAYIVGGYVRDYLLGIESKDIDICTNAPIDTIIKLFKDRGVAHKQYYAFHIEKDGYSYDITSYRKELRYRRNKPSEIAPAKDLATDLLRRDFTINTLAIDSNGRLIDILGARKDLNAKVLKVVGDTDKKLREDKTRIIRALRFACTLDFDLSPEILEFMSTKKAHLVSEIPNEYKKRELDKIFDSKNSYKFFFFIKRYNLEKYFNIHLNMEIYNIKETYNRYGIWAQIETDLPFSNKERKIIDDIIKIIKSGDIDVNDVSKYSDDVIYNAASILNMIDKVKSLKELVTLHSIIDIDLSVGLMIKYVSANNFKKVYRDIERKIIEGYLANESSAIEEYLRNL